VRTFSIILSLVVMVATFAFVFWALAWNIVQQRRQANLKRTWTHFGLSIVFVIMFVATFVAHAIANWTSYAQDSREHHERPTASGYLVDFSENTLQNWQSEFLQNLSFIVLAAMLIHRGSAESKDSEEQIQAALERIEQRLDDAGIGS
jgi:lysylphosphatidylglycerol synthetase-like protein (DUF2156 family)